MATSNFDLNFPKGTCLKKFIQNQGVTKITLKKIIQIKKNFLVPKTRQKICQITIEHTVYDLVHLWGGLAHKTTHPYVEYVKQPTHT